MEKELLRVCATLPTVAKKNYLQSHRLHLKNVRGSWLIIGHYSLIVPLF